MAQQTTGAPSPTSITFGQPVTFTATVQGQSGTPTGSVNFYDGTVDAAHLLGSGTLNQATPDTATYTTTALQLAAGNHTILAVYQAAGAFTTSQGSTPLTVNVAGTSISNVTATPTGSSAFGQSINFTATASAEAFRGPIVGTVTFFDNGSTPLGSASVNATGTQAVTIQVANLAVGSHSITAQFVANADFAGSGSPQPLSQQVTADQTAIVVSSTNPTAVYGEPIITAAVTSTSAPGNTPTGSVTFHVNNGATTLNETDPVSSGVATLQMALSPGAYTISADYNSTNGNFTASSTTASLSQAVAEANVSVAVGGNPNPGTFDQPVIFSAVISAMPPGGSAAGASAIGGTADLIVDGNTVQAGAGVVNGQVTFSPIATLDIAHSPHAIQVVYNGDGNYSGATGNGTETIGPATPTITWTNPPDITFGTALGATQLDATSTINGSFSYFLSDGTTPAPGVILNAGAGQTLRVTFTPTDTTDYVTASATLSINVLKATPIITWSNPADIVFGTALGATQLDADANVAGSFTYTLADGATPAGGAVLNGGLSQTLNVSFAPTDAVDYSVASAQVVINVQKATPVLTWSNPADIAFSTPLGAAQLDATASVAGTFHYLLADDTTSANGAILPTGANQSLNAAFTPTDSRDYNSGSATVAINVVKATPIVTWRPPASIAVGTALGAAQLDASANVPGVFTYTLADNVTPAAGAVLSAGLGQALNVAFVPTDSIDYTSAMASVTIDVSAQASVLTWNNPADITFGTALGAAQLDATANDPGAFTYTLSDGLTSAAGAQLHAGMGQTLNVAFTPSNPAAFSSATASVIINVLKVTPTLTWPLPTDITFGRSPAPLSSTPRPRSPAISPILWPTARRPPAAPCSKGGSTNH